MRMLAELQALAEGLASRLDRGVAIDDPNFRLMVHTAHHGQVDETRLESILRMRPPERVLHYLQSLHFERKPEEVHRLAAVESLALLSRVLAPIRADGQLFGYLSLIDPDEALSEEELESVADVARSAAMVMRRDSLLEDLRAGRQRELLRDVLSDDMALRASAAEELEGVEGGLSGPVQALIVRIPTGQLPPGRDLSATVDAALDRAVRRTVTCRCLYLSRATHGLVVMPSRGMGELEVQRLAEAACREVARSLDVADAHSALGDPVEHVSDLLQSYEQARLALQVSEIVTTFGPHVAWSELGVYRTLVHLPLRSLPPGLVPSELVALLKETGGADLLRTVEVYLDEAADARRTVARLNIHRTSLYYRLHRFTELTGLDLHDGGGRLSIHVGVKLARLTGLVAFSLPPAADAHPRAAEEITGIRHL